MTYVAIAALRLKQNSFAAQAIPMDPKHTIIMGESFQDYS